MFVDDRRNEGPAEGRDRGAHQPPQPDRAEQRQRPPADREVPLDRHGALSAAVHAWLDGELPESAVRKGETGKDVEFWRMIGQETAQMRRTRTPAHVEALIMDALPQTAPPTVTPWHRREIVTTRRTALTSAIVLAAVTAVVTAVILSLT